MHGKRSIKTIWYIDVRLCIDIEHVYVKTT
jgi:hypothetical protein